MASVTESLRPDFAERLRLSGWSIALLIMSLPFSLPLFVTTIVGISLIGVFGLGIPLVLGSVWITRALADTHRRTFAHLLGVEIPRPYRRRSGQTSWTITSVADAWSVWRQLLAVARDPATWKDLVWLFVNSTVGFVVYVMVIALGGGVVWYAATPLLWWVLERSAGPLVAVNVMGSQFGIWAIDSQGAAFAGIPIAVVFLGLWWWLSPPLLRGYALLSRGLLGPTDAAALTARVQELTESRAETVDAQAAELRRLERDLHDGAQARLVSLGMSLGMAEELLESDPDGAARLLAEAREDTGRALAELRELVRGVHPPVLADRGLAGAVEALAAAHPLPVDVADHLPGRAPAPVESAAYFAIAETLTNVSKHARAGSARVRLGHDGERLRLTVSDDGIGGAEVVDGGGLHGVRRRLAAFDGTVSVTSPEGGPTIITMEIPCVLSSPKITPSSGTG